MTGPVDLGSVGSTDGFNAVQQRVVALRRRIDVLADPSLFSTALASVTALPATSAATASSAATATTPASSGPTGDDVVARARSYLGVPYVYAGTSRSGIDCSGLVQRVYGDLGVSLPRVSWEQAKEGTEVPSLAQARPGDVLAFGDPVHHVAIYVGDGKMIAAPQPGEVVKLQDVYETPSTIRRIIPGSATVSAATSTSVVTGAVSGLSAAVRDRSAQFAAAESRYGLPTGLLSAVAQAESGGDVAARSPAGAVGLMQLMPATAAALGVDPTDPAQAIDGAARLLRGHLQRFGSIPLALAAYNAGGGAVERYGGIPPYRETQDYVRKITAMLGMYA